MLVRALLAELDRKALGVVHFFADPDNLRAEYAIAVRSDWKGRGVGYLLMSRLITKSQLPDDKLMPARQSAA